MHVSIRTNERRLFTQRMILRSLERKTKFSEDWGEGVTPFKEGPSARLLRRGWLPARDTPATLIHICYGQISNLPGQNWNIILMICKTERKSKITITIGSRTMVRVREEVWALLSMVVLTRVRWVSLSVIVWVRLWFHAFIHFIFTFIVLIHIKTSFLTLTLKISS